MARQREDDPSFDHVLSLMCRVCTRRPEGSLLGQRRLNQIGHDELLLVNRATRGRRRYP